MPERRSGEAGHISLVDVLDRVLAKGAIIAGDVTIAVADVDLVRLDLQVVLGAIDTLGSLVHVATEPESIDEQARRTNGREPSSLPVGSRPLPSTGSASTRAP